MQIFVVGSKIRIFSATECISVVQGHPRSLILAPIERAYDDFVLVINSNFGPILHRFWEIAPAENCKFFLHPLSFNVLAMGEPFGICVWTFNRQDQSPCTVAAPALRIHQVLARSWKYLPGPYKYYKVKIEN